ncbi:hypothetical protein EDC01DRAFT_411625 [Geopyxis carbonaria]|nr:hypothetical protein EDC01DRAFT_411625 [Geopyxis carbonaria]
MKPTLLFTLLITAAHAHAAFLPKVGGGTKAANDGLEAVNTGVGALTGSASPPTTSPLTSSAFSHPGAENYSLAKCSSRPITAASTVYNTTLNIRLTQGKSVCNFTSTGAPLTLYGSSDLDWRLTTETSGCADNASITFDGSNDGWKLNTQRSGGDGYTFAGAATDLDTYYQRRLDGVKCGDAKGSARSILWRPMKAANGSMPELSGEFTVDEASVLVWGAWEGAWVGDTEKVNGTFVVSAEGMKGSGLDANVTGEKPSWSTPEEIVPESTPTSGAVKERWGMMAGLGTVAAMMAWL